MLRLLTFLIKGFRLLLTPFTGARCRFYPTCSDYALQAVALHGPLKGAWLALRRLLRCHPFSPGGVDPVPPGGARRAKMNRMTNAESHNANPPDTESQFAARDSIEQVEEGDRLAPKFDDNGLLPVVTTDYASGEVLMHGYMNREALARTIDTGDAHYWSRSRRRLWRKGETSGLVQKVRQILIDDDQDAVWLRVEVGGDGASCHVGYRSCFYREVLTGGPDGGGARLRFTQTDKMFDPEVVYRGQPNPTRL